MFFGHLPELLIVLVILLLVIGPGKIPSIGGAVGKSIREFKRERAEVRAAPRETGLPEPEAPRQG
jgi:sec-independent protein translocase protein TatA